MIIGRNTTASVNPVARVNSNVRLISLQRFFNMACSMIYVSFEIFCTINPIRSFYV